MIKIIIIIIRKEPKKKQNKNPLPTLFGILNNSHIILDACDYTFLALWVNCSQSFILFGFQIFRF
jgi:hypothetical protein